MGDTGVEGNSGLGEDGGVSGSVILGVPTTGGRPKTPWFLGKAVTVGRLGVVCSGGGSWVGIRYTKEVPFCLWVSISVRGGP